MLFSIVLASVTRGFCCVWSERLDADDWLNGWGGEGVKVGQVKSAWI